MTEEWRAVVGWEGFYEVSDRGNVRSVPRVVEFRNGRSQSYEGQALSASPDSDGYPFVTLYRAGTRQGRCIHRLVGEAFLGPLPNGLETLHRSGVKTDNHVTNLRYGTPAENVADTVAHGNHIHARREVCGRGHRLGGPNAISETCRSCRACRLGWKQADRDRARGLPFDVTAAADRHYERIMRGAT